MNRLEPEQRRIWVALIGAASMTGASSIGLGFMVQTSLFTTQYGQSLAAVVITMIVMDTIAKLNIWSTLDISGPRGQELTNRVLPGPGNVIAILITFGGFTFAIGNMGGTTPGPNTVCDLLLRTSYLILCGLAVSLFPTKNASNGINRASQALNMMVLIILLIMALQTYPPMNCVANGLLSPEQPLSLLVPLTTLLGGSTGGYIAHAGAHHFLDAGILGWESLRGIQRSTLLTCGITDLPRILTFLVVFGVCITGGQAAPSAIKAAKNPAVQMLLLGAGKLGSRLFSVAFFCTGITTIIGSSYTLVPFLKALYPTVGRNEKQFIIGFIVLATIPIATIGKATALLVIAGVINGFVLPLTLAITL